MDFETEDKGGRGARGGKPGGGRSGGKRGFARRKVCRFCADKNVGIDYAAVFNRMFGSDQVSFAADEDQGVAHRISGSYDW